jgi:hypothetical protein
MHLNLILPGYRRQDRLPRSKVDDPDNLARAAGFERPAFGPDAKAPVAVDHCNH